MIKAQEEARKFLILVSLLSLISYVFIPSTFATELVIKDNGSGSESTLEVSSTNNFDVTQVNNAEVSNNVMTTANTGENTDSKNSEGSVNISTGEINTQLTVENSGNISSVQKKCCDKNTSAQISENGSSSTNQISVSDISLQDVKVYQNATITNSVTGSINTGRNESSGDSGGSAEIETGNISVQGSIINGPINYSNLEAASGLSAFDANIGSNGVNSRNRLNASFDFSNSVYVSNFSDIKNVGFFDLNTGENSASNNEEGDIRISTGDITLNFFIKNFLNLSKVKVSCCEEGKEEEPPSIFEPPKEEGKTQEVVSSGGGGGGQILPEAAAIEAGGPGVGGLSDTSSGETQALIFFLGLALISFGGRIATNELIHTASRSKTRQE